jgi:hypothetical protein
MVRMVNEILADGSGWEPFAVSSNDNGHTTGIWLRRLVHS